MTTHLKIDDELIQEALQFGEQQTKCAVVEDALREYVQRRKQLKIIELFGTIEYDDDYDYKKQRQQK
jgi:Arc/MetJ family transcription regulator